jgi:hypothetical protein
MQVAVAADGAGPFLAGAELFGKQLLHKKCLPFGFLYLE